MRKRIHIYTYLIITIIIFNSCGDSTELKPDIVETKQEIFSEQLTNKTGGWTIANGGIVSIGGVNDVSDEWSDFKLSFNQFSYSTEGGKSGVWPGSGTWSYAKKDRTDEILRDDGILIYSSMTESTLVLRFTVKSNYSADGRVSALGGEYTFELK